MHFYLLLLGRQVAVEAKNESSVTLFQPNSDYLSEFSKKFGLTA
jgi:hypothetical protein